MPAHRLKFEDGVLSLITNLYLEGKSCATIGKSMNMNATSIWNALKRNGVPIRPKQRVKDLSGNTFGRLSVLSLDKTHNGRAYWRCRCNCGKDVVVSGEILLKGQSRSCGCLNIDRSSTHRMSYSNEYAMYARAKYRAKRDGKEFEINPWDVIIPSHCPVLGIKLTLGTVQEHDYSPSIDRLDSSGGYTLDNICVISNRANRIKGNATVEELQQVIDYMKGTKR